MQQIIHINNLRVHCLLGVFPHEREYKQDVFLDVSLEGNWQKSFESDDIKDTLDYDELSTELVTLLEKEQFQLLERAAHQLAAHCLKKSGVSSVRLSIKKPQALNAAELTAFEILLP